MRFFEVQDETRGTLTTPKVFMNSQVTLFYCSSDRLEVFSTIPPPLLLHCISCCCNVVATFQDS